MTPEEKADALLRSLLTPKQEASMDQLGFFELRGNMGGGWRIYTTQGWVGNLRFQKKIGREVLWVRRCAHPSMMVCCGNRIDHFGIPHFGETAPKADAFIAQLLTIQANEALMRNIAQLA